MGILGFVKQTREVSLGEFRRKSGSDHSAIGILLLLSTFCNLTTTGPVCYPIVAETPAGYLRNKVSSELFRGSAKGKDHNHRSDRLSHDRHLFEHCHSKNAVPDVGVKDFQPSLATEPFHSSWNWMAKCGLFYAGTNLLCNIWSWFRLPETKAREGKL